MSSHHLFAVFSVCLLQVSVVYATAGECIPVLTAAMYKIEGDDWCEQACISPVLAPAVMQFGDVHFGRCDGHGYPFYDHTQDMKLFKVDLYKKDNSTASNVVPVVGGWSAGSSVCCSNPEQCLEIDMADGFDSQFWKDQGYKYNHSQHPECVVGKCDRGTYPTLESNDPIPGYTGVAQVKYGKPPAVSEVFAAAEVCCSNPEQCLEIDMADGFDSQFWKDQGYKYDHKLHPECVVGKCDRGTYPTLESNDPIPGYTGVAQLKYGKPPAVSEVFAAAEVCCSNPEQCLEIDMADGFDSQFWKDQGYKYDHKLHPECVVGQCDRGTYPTLESNDPIPGYTGVAQVKYGKPPAVSTQ